MKLLGRILACLILLLLIVPSAFAQFDTATVVGTVKDNTGAVVPGATVTLTNLETGIAVVRVSDANGSYEFMTVRVGRYKVTGELLGFSTALVDNIQVAVGARQRVDLKLDPGKVTETVRSSASSTLLETDSSQRGQVITGEPGGRAAAERPRVLRPRAPQPGRPRVVDRHGLHREPARRLVQRQRPAQHVQQLPARRRRQQRLRHQQPGLLEPGDAALAGRRRRSSRSSPTT